jgi:hypothetical protein
MTRNRSRNARRMAAAALCLAAALGVQMLIDSNAYAATFQPETLSLSRHAPAVAVEPDWGGCHV